MLPRLFQLGPFTVHSYGLMVMLGFVAGIVLSSRLAKRRGLAGEALVDAAPVMLLASIAGARLLFVALNWGDFADRPWTILSVWQGGMSFHGGAIAGVASGIYCLKKRGLSPAMMVDAAAPGLAVGYAIGRIGCLLNGCCHGGPSDLPWAMSFPDGEDGVRYHPVQLYAAILNGLLTWWLARQYLAPHRVGQVINSFVGWYSVYRFLIESLRRGVSAKVVWGGLTEAQWFSAWSIVAAIAVHFLLLRGTTLLGAAPHRGEPLGETSG